MLKLLVVDAWRDRRADIVDALCEIPGIEVRATAEDASTALGLIDSTSIDAVVASNDLPGAAIVTLIDCARRRGLTEIIVAIAGSIASPGMTDCWHDLGARHVVGSLEELVRRIGDLATARARDHQRRTTPLQLELVAGLEARPAVRSYADADGGGAVVGPARPRTQTSEDLAVGSVLHDALTRFGGVVPPEVQLHLEVGQDVPRVRCVVADVERLALLLVRSACDALPLGGKVWVCVEREDQRHLRIEVLESSGRPRSLGSDLHVIRAIAKRHAGDVRVVDLGGATSIQVILPAIAQDQN